MIGHAQICKIMIKSSAITNRLSITMAELIIDYLFSSDKPALIYTVFDLISAHTPISAQSSNSVVFRLQPVYFLSTSL